jgi:uncharacterized protein (TIGR03435 family)
MITTRQATRHLRRRLGAALSLATLVALVHAQEVVGRGTIKPSRSREPWTSVRAQEISAESISLRDLLSIAWKVSPAAIDGAPRWVNSDRFDVSIRAPKISSGDDLRVLAQSLISKTFTLKARIEIQEQPAFALTLIDRERPKLKVAKGLGPSECEPLALDFGVRDLVCHKMTMSDLANALPRFAPMYANHPVVDMTGLKEAFEIHLTWSARSGANAGAGQTLFQALESELGITLEQKDLSIPTLVIESIERFPAGRN